MKNVSKMCLFGGTIVAAGIAAPASAQLNIREVTGDFQHTASSVLVETWDTGTQPDWGILGFDGPVGPLGGGVIPYGFFTFSTIDSEMYGPGGASRGAGGTGLVGVGPSAGFGNPINFVGANFFDDSFKIDFGGARCGFLWTGTSLLGGGLYDLYVDGALAFPGLSSDITYFLSGGTFSSVSMYDPYTNGAEGIYGYAEVWAVPAPGSVALLGLGGLAAIRRRRA